MEWLAILALGALLWAQSVRVGALTRKLEALERRLAPEPKPHPGSTREVVGAPGEELEPLLLDTPLPEPSNDTDDDLRPPSPAKPPSAAAIEIAPTPAKPWPSLSAALPPVDAQALAVLAILVALLAPQLTARVPWAPTGLTIYLVSVAAAGFATAAWRRWAWAAVVTALGLYFWFAAAIAADDLRRALTLVSLAALGGVSLAFREPEMEDAAARLPWSRLRAELPTATLCASSVLMLWAWVAIADTGSGSVARVAWVGTILVALAAASVRARIAAAASFAVSAATLTLGFAAYLALRAELRGPGADFYPFILFGALTIALAALFARPHREGRAMVATAGAIGAAVLVMLAAFSRQNWHGPAAWAALFAAAAILAALAQISARNEEKRGLAVGAWAGASAALLFLGIESAFPASLRAPAYVGASLFITTGLAWRGWAILGYAALASAGLAIAHTLSAPSHGPAEAAGYALILLSAPLALAEAARRRVGASLELDAITRGATWVGLGGAGLLILAARHPWWGAQDAAASGDVATALAVVAQAAAAALALLLAREFSRRDPRTRFAASCAAALFALSFGHCAIRWLYQRGAMDDGTGFVGIEGLANALWPLALVLGAGRFTPRSDRPHWRDLRRIAEHAVWPALGFAALGMWVVFTPWWGLVPARIGSPLTALLALLAYLAAAWMSYTTRGIPYIAGAIWFAKARTLATIGHLLVAATLGVRWVFHREAIAQAPVGNIEMWLYSAILAAFGARAYWLGLRRDAKYLRGAGIALLLAAAAKMLLVDMGELSGGIRIALVVGLAALWLTVAWARREYVGVRR